MIVWVLTSTQNSRKCYWNGGRSYHTWVEDAARAVQFVRAQDAEKCRHSFQSSHSRLISHVEAYETEITNPLEKL